MTLAVVLSVALGCAPAALVETGQPSAPTAGQATGDLPLPAEVVGDLEPREGLFTLYPDPLGGALWLELPSPDPDGVMAEVLFAESLATGLGSNPVGLDRGQVGDSRILRLRRVGSRVLFELPNLRFRARSDDAAERTAVEESFAPAVLWATEIAALDAEGRSLIDLAPFLVTDLHNTRRVLAWSGQGSFRLDAQRSTVNFDHCFAFPDNLELQALVTWVTDDIEPGSEVAATSARADALSLVQHVSWIRLPDDDYRPRRADPRIGMLSTGYANYAAALDAPIRERLVYRHRLEKIDPSAASSPVREPIVYYIDRGAPEPVRSALLDGARWWAEAFEAAGFEDAFRVELLPEGVHPLDARYHVVEWVHRATRGWSYGGFIADPRTGEIVKGHVNLGSLRVRQDRLLFEGLVGTDGTGSGRQDDPIELALARIRQLSAHEIGHTLGIAHNFAASTYDRGSVMDYPVPRVGLDAEGRIDLSDVYGVGLGAWDIATVAWAYGEPAAGEDEEDYLERTLRASLDDGLVFLSDADARPADAADPRASLWDDGPDAVDELARLLRVREVALDDFAENRIAVGQPLAHLQEVLVPVYLMHRYQLKAAGKTLGGVELAHAVRGDSQAPVLPISAERQRRALEVMLDALAPERLDLPDDVLALLAPRPFGEGRNRELFASATGQSFDLLGAATTAAGLVLDELLQPARLERLAERGRRDPSTPSPDQVMGRVVDRTVGLEIERPRLEPIARRVERLVTQRLVAITADPSLDGTLRASAWTSLDRVRERLRARDAAGDRWLLDELDRFAARPWDGPPALAVPAPAPPGSPIGADLALIDAHASCGAAGHAVR
ncbi:MAG: zinc-dependent metalloprotease [Acidobacteriota bacterium]